MPSLTIQKLGAIIVVDGAAVPNLAAYMAWREAQIDAGALPSWHRYSIDEMEAHFHGEHDV